MVETKDLNTYHRGFHLISRNDITKKQFMVMCDELGNEFNRYYNTDEYSFSPERITEGGIIFNNFSHFSNNYKTMRLYFYNQHEGIRSLYEYIDDDILNNWRNSEDILIERNKQLGTFLKSFYRAPEWTNQELKIFKKCFLNIGLMIKKVPIQKELRETINPKYYLDLFKSLKN